jgi:putative transposase
MNETTPSPLNNVITIDDERIKNHLDRVVRGSVEETLNALLDAEADRLCNAQRYERSAARQDTRAGYYERNLQTKAGEVRLKTRNNPLERLLREIRRRTRVVGAFPDSQSALNLAAARLRHIAGTAWSTKRYLNMELLKNKHMKGAISQPESGCTRPGHRGAEGGGHH